MIAIVLAGCSHPSTGTVATTPHVAPTPTADTVTRRFAVGVVPEYSVSALYGEAAHCYLEFAPSDVIAIEHDAAGADVPRVVKEGKFPGSCDHGSIQYTFEGVTTRKVQVDLAATHVGLDEFQLDAAHPEWTIGIRAFPLDHDGKRLDVGRIGWAMQGYARWHLTDGCNRVVKIVAIIPEVEGVGTTRPGDEISLAPIAPGTCNVDIDYFGAKTNVTVSVISSAQPSKN